MRVFLMMKGVVASNMNFISYNEKITNRRVSLELTVYHTWFNFQRFRFFAGNRIFINYCLYMLNSRQFQKLHRYIPIFVLLFYFIHLKLSLFFMYINNILTPTGHCRTNICYVIIISIFLICS